MNVTDLSVVIPVYNEKGNLTELIDRCLAACRKTSRSFEIILVDDGSGAGALIASGGIGFGVLLMVLRFVYGAMWAAEGVFTLFALLFIFIGAQFVGLGLLGEYIGRIYHDVRSRPRFFIQEIRGANP